jgi:hypothetical protein
MSFLSVLESGVMLRKGKRSSFVSLCAIFAAFLTAAAICSATPTTQSYGVFDVTFYNNGDSDGYETGEQNWTSQQMTDVAASISAWQGNIENIPGRQLRMHAFWNELNVYGTDVLGGSGSARVYGGGTIWNMGEYVWKEESDIDFGNSFDTIIQYDITAAGFIWNFGSNAPVSGQIDFRSVITHEIGHSVGWDSSYSPPPNDNWGLLGGGLYDGLTEWDKNLVDGSGNRAQSGSSGTPGNFDQNDNPVYFDGANAVALYGSPVPIYAPTAFRGGSSLAHLDEAALGNFLMSPMVADGQMIRTVSDLEWAMMKDMGWTVIPEPATIGLLALGSLVFTRRGEGRSRSRIGKKK